MRNALLCVDSKALRILVPGAGTKQPHNYLFFSIINIVSNK